MTQTNCVFLLTVVLLAAGCGSKIIAPTTPDGGRVSLAVYFDRGLEGKTEDQQNQLNQLGDWMEADLVRMYNQYGYKVEQITSPDQYTPTPGHYFLSVTTVNYNPGSKAARMMVGMGAGSASLDTHYELKDQEGKVLITKEHGRASSKNWTHIARQLNLDMLVEITPILGGEVK